MPALMHDVHTFCRLGVAPTRVRIDWMLGFQRRGVRRCEYEMLLPKPGPLPQTSQVAATVSNSRGKNPARGFERKTLGSAARVPAVPVS